MEKEQVKFYLSQSLEELRKAQQLLENSDDNVDTALGVNLTSALNYLYGAWSLRNTSPGEIERMSQEEYEKVIFSQPLDLDPRFNNKD